MRRTALLLFLAVATFLTVSYLASRTKSFTYDEPLHLAQAYTIRHHGDFRLDPEDPPLFMRLASLALPEGCFTYPAPGDPALRDIETDRSLHWTLTSKAIFQTGPSASPPQATLNRARLLMLLPAGLLAAAALLLAYLLAPAYLRTAALLITAALFCFDPTLLAHAPLIKNDISAALAFALVAASLVLLGQRITLTSVALLLLGLSIGVTTKFSGLLLGPLILLSLCLRATRPEPWLFRSTPLRGRWLPVVALTLLCALTAWLAIWTVYGFRFTTAPVVSPTSPDLDYDLSIYRSNVAYLSVWRNPTDSETAAQPLPLTLRAATWAVENHLIPASYGKGFIYTYATTVLRNAYLLGEVSVTGWWYFFPLCLLFKSPLASLLLLDLAIYVAYLFLFKPRRPAFRSLPWPLLVVLTFTTVYWLSAITGGFNIGIRHIIPVIPFMHVLTGVATAWALSHLPRLRLVVPALLAFLAFETLYRFPNYIAFFNFPSQAYGPPRLLGDSNLDWGQDLIALREWQLQNPDTPLALAYFGSATPEAYGLVYTPFPGTLFHLSPAKSPEEFTGVVALSASSLQQLTFPPNQMKYYAYFRALTPFQTLGNSVYLYHWPPSLSDVSPRPLKMQLRRGDDVTPLTWTPPPRR